MLVVMGEIVKRKNKKDEKLASGTEIWSYLERNSFLGYSIAKGCGGIQRHMTHERKLVYSVLLSQHRYHGAEKKGLNKTNSQPPPKCVFSVHSNPHWSSPMSLKFPINKGEHSFSILILKWSYPPIIDIIWSLEYHSLTKSMIDDLQKPKLKGESDRRRRPI